MHISIAHLLEVLPQLDQSLPVLCQVAGMSGKRPIGVAGIIFSRCFLIWGWRPAVAFVKGRKWTQLLQSILKFVDEVLHCLCPALQLLDLLLPVNHLMLCALPLVIDALRQGITSMG